MDPDNTFVARALTAFLSPVLLSALCFVLVHSLARSVSASPRQFYVRRLIWMIIVAVLWLCFNPALHQTAFFGNTASPLNAERHAAWMASQMGWAYGIHAIWAWLVLALIDRPKLCSTTPAGL